MATAVRVRNPHVRHLVNPTAADLFHCMAQGIAVSIPFSYFEVVGLIYKIQVETGYVEGEQPVHFLVDVMTESGLQTDIYVKTQDL